MEPEDPLRILILGSRPQGAGAERRRRALEGALAGLGPGVEILADRGSADAGSFDLVVVDLAAGGLPLLRSLPPGGPPRLALLPEGGEGAAEPAWRFGATDCVVFREGAEEALLAAAAEHLHAFREARARARASRRIESLEDLNDAIVRAVPAGLAVLDGEFRVVRANPTFSRQLGLRRGEVAGRPLAEVLPAELLEGAGVRGMLEAACRGREVSPRLASCNLGEGSRRAFEVRARQLAGGDPVLLLLLDVTERERLSRRLEAIEGYHESVLGSLDSAVLGLDGEGRVASANPAAEALLGRPAEALRGAPLDPWLGCPEVRDALGRAIAGGGRTRDLETELRRPDGAPVPVAFSCAPRAAAGGSRDGAVVVLRDLRGIRELQAQVVQAEKLASVGQLAAGVAHEINNPMGFIHANLVQLAEYAGDLERVVEALRPVLAAARAGAPEAELRAAAEALVAAWEAADGEFLAADLGKAVRESLEGSDRIRHIVRDLRDFARRDPEEPVLTDIHEALDSTVRIVSSIARHSVRFERDYGELPPLPLHPVAIRQVFMNLLVNAVQAIEARGGGREGATGTVRLSTRRAGGTARITVVDDGAGIPRELLDRIFDPFFTTKEVGSGMGLGLSTSFAIVRRHGGALRAESPPGGGAAFHIELPLERASGGRGAGA